MPLKIYEFEKRSLVSGVFWQTLSEAEKFKEEIKSKAKSIKSNLVVVRKSGIIQAGFASSEEGAKPGMYSLAVLISLQVAKMGAPRNWMASFSLPDGNYCYVASRDGIFLPESDAFGGQDKILGLMLEDYSVGDWDKVIAPSEFGLPNAQEVEFKDLLPKLGKKGKKIDFSSEAKLTEVTRGLPWKQMTIGVVTTSVFYAGYHEYQDYRDSQQQKEFEAKLESARQHAMDMLAEKKLENPWRNMERPQDYIGKCLSLLSSDKITPSAWKLSKYSCTDKGYEYVWARMATTAEDLIRVVPNATVNDAGDSAMLAIPRPVEFKQQDEKVKPAQLVINHFKSEFQKLGIPLEIRLGGAVSINGDPIDEGNLDWKVYKFRYKTKFSPISGVIDLNEDGIRITKVTFTPENGTVSGDWDIEGDFYTMK